MGHGLGSDKKFKRENIAMLETAHTKRGCPPNSCCAIWVWRGWGLYEGSGKVKNNKIDKNKRYVK